jgi:predicted CoA-binding protein
VHLDPEIYGDDDRIRRLLTMTSTWAVVGLGDNPERAAFGVAAFLQRHGKRIVPVHPRAETVHGEIGYRTLSEARAEVGHIDVVDMFVNGRLVGREVDAAIGIGADAVWLQLEVIDEPAARRARAAGLLTVMDRCPAIEWPLVRPTTALS